MSEPEVTADTLIAAHGDQAYYAGLDLVMQLLREGKQPQCRSAAIATRALMMRGYHHHQKKGPVAKEETQ